MLSKNKAFVAHIILLEKEFIASKEMKVMWIMKRFNNHKIRGLQNE